jgi:hypothetical protein
LITWETDAESWYARDRESWREAFYIALWHELVWLSARSLSPEWLVAAEKLRSLTRDKWDENDRKLEEEIGRKTGMPLYPGCVMSYPNMSLSLSQYKEFGELFNGPDFPWNVSVSPPKLKIPSKLRQQVLALHDGKCWVCGKTIDGSFDVHHIVPESEFGPTILSNLAPVHRECHRKVGLASLAR